MLPGDSSLKTNSALIRPHQEVGYGLEHTIVWLFVETKLA